MPRLTPASEEVIEHHINQHHCEIDEPHGFWVTCPDGKMGAVLCGGCFETLFVGSMPGDLCIHGELFFEHVERHALPPIEGDQ